MSIAVPAPQVRQTVDDLMKTRGKAELIKGRVVVHSGDGNAVALIRGEIGVSLHLHCKKTGVGTTFSSTAAFVVPELSTGRESFCADVAYVAERLATRDEGPYPGPPAFAVEVRRRGVTPEVMVAKREEYFEAGTKAVWEVILEPEIVVLFLPGELPCLFRRGDVAHAGLVVPGWSMPVNAIFDD